MEKKQNYVTWIQTLYNLHKSSAHSERPLPKTKKIETYQINEKLIR